MKQIACFLLILMLVVPVVSLAETEEVVEVAEDVILEEINTIVAKAKVLEVGEVYEETIDNMVEKKQKVKLEILEGEYQGKEFEATYILSYDIDNKILAHELKKGNKVFARN